MVAPILKMGCRGQEVDVDVADTEMCWDYGLQDDVRDDRHHS